LKPSPTKEYPNAVKVLSKKGKQLGFLDDRLGGEISRFIANGGKVTAKISDLTGGTKEKKTRGCNIQITKQDETVSAVPRPKTSGNNDDVKVDHSLNKNPKKSDENKETSCLGCLFWIGVVVAILLWIIKLF
jgi:hypothetical protein